MLMIAMLLLAMTLIRDIEVCQKVFVTAVQT